MSPPPPGCVFQFLHREFDFKFRVMPGANSTILFTAILLPTEKLELPKSARAKLPSQATTRVEGTINGYPFRAVLQSNNEGVHYLKINKDLQKAANAAPGDTVNTELTRMDEEPEPRLPIELHKALQASPKALTTWTNTTPIARRDWILWITSGKQPETRLIRIEKTCSMLASGKRRVCCFGGLNWLTKDHRSVDTWGPLP